MFIFHFVLFVIVVDPTRPFPSQATSGNLFGTNFPILVTS